MFTFGRLGMNNLFSVICDFRWFDFFDVGPLSEISGFFFHPNDIIFLVLLFVTCRRIFTTREGTI